jgi:hypothetical protein
MDYLEVIANRQKLWSEVIGHDLVTCGQNSIGWQTAKIGVVSASAASAINSPGTQTFSTYVNRKIGEILSRSPSPSVKNKTLQWGIDNEPPAFNAYQIKTMHRLKQVSLIYLDDKMQVAASPDALFFHREKGLEIKCPATVAESVRFMRCLKAKRNEELQVQMSMAVLDLTEWDVAKFDPRMVLVDKINITTYKRDDVIIKQLRIGWEAATNEINEALDKKGVSFGQQWDNFEALSCATPASLILGVFTECNLDPLDEQVTGQLLKQIGVGSFDDLSMDQAENISEELKLMFANKGK